MNLCLTPPGMNRLRKHEVRYFPRSFKFRRKRSVIFMSHFKLGETKPPSQEHIIGKVMTGDASLTRGEGFAMGTIPVMQCFVLRE